jgi:hypothetical protein
MAQHFHSTDTVNGEKHYHATVADLTLYLAATGEDGVNVTNCYDPKCVEVEDDEEWGPDSAQELLERGPR